MYPANSKGEDGKKVTVESIKWNIAISDQYLVFGVLENTGEIP